MTTSILIYKVWQDIFLQIPYMDAYLPSSTYLRHYLHALHINNGILDVGNIYRLDTLYRSITVLFSKQSTQGQMSEDRLPTSRLLTKVMSILQALPYLLNLRKLYQIHSIGFRQFRLSYFLKVF